MTTAVFLRSTVEILYDKNKKLMGIVFQDGIMKSVFTDFPEVK